MAKINTQLIASWRDNEVIQESKFNAVFKCIGDAINKTDDQYQELIKKISELHLATRWIGQVENFAGIQAYIDTHKNDEAYQAPNNPLPSAGDVIIVSNNSDDPNLPPSINPGKYIYIFVEYIENNKFKHKWEIYNPFALITATAYNDGLMSKEDYKKLSELPAADVFNATIEDIKNQIKTNQDNIAILQNDNQDNKENIANLKQRTSTLETNKQDRATDLANYKTKNVEDNLVEVKRLVDDTLRQDIVIYQPNDADTLITTDINKGIATIPLELDKSKYQEGDFIKAYFLLSDDTEVVSSMEVELKMLTKDTSYSASGNVVLDKSLYMVKCDYSEGAFNIAIVGVSGADPKEVKEVKRTLNDFKHISLLKVIKDIGVSDYMMAEVIIQDITEFLGSNLGRKRTLIPNHVQADGFNGYRVGDTIDVGYQYLWGMNANEVYLGGTKLRQDIDFEEVVAPDTAYSHEIRILKEINIEKEGTLEIITYAIVVNSFVIKVWNKKDSYVVGELVLHNSKLWYAIKPSQALEPSEANSKYWNPFSTNIDLDLVKTRIKEYIDQEVVVTVKTEVKKYDKGRNVVAYKDNYSTFGTSEEALNCKKLMIKNEAYRLVTQTTDSGIVVVEVVIDINEPIWEIVSSTDNQFVIKWNYNIYQPALANVEVLTATDDQVDASVARALAQEHKSNPIMFNELVYEAENEKSLKAWLKENSLTEDNIIRVEIPRFYEGQSLLFKTKEKADRFITANRLTAGTDFEINTEHLPLGIGENGEIIENKLKRSDLPNITIPVEIRDNKRICSPDGGGRDGLTGGWTVGYPRVDSFGLFIKLNGGIEQTNNISSYIERYEIIFLKDIY